MKLGITVIVGFVVGFGSAYVVTDLYNVIKAQNAAESECIADFIRTGIERKDIARGDGTCWVETNGYHKTK
jgi:hypothetical protein